MSTDGDIGAVTGDCDEHVGGRAVFSFAEESSVGALGTRARGRKCQRHFGGRIAGDAHGTFENSRGAVIRWESAGVGRRLDIAKGDRGT
mgnify:CR=1 FL=1